MTMFTQLRRKARALAGASLILAGLAAPAALAQPADYSGIEASPAYWVLSDADSTVYLFGTFHILPASLDWRTEELDAALTSADTLYVEADVHSAEVQAQMQTLIPQYGLNPQGVTLSSLLDAETQEKLAEVAPTVGASPAMLEPMRPWLAQLVLAVGQLQMLGFDPNAGVEIALIAAAAESETQMGYFETAEQQIRFFADLPDDIQIAAFSKGLEQMERTPELVDDLVRAWAVGDLQELDRQINGEMRADTPEIHDAIIVRRNRDWVPQILEILDGEGVSFIAVGAGHLPGEDGVVELLRAQGVDITRH